MYQMFQYFGLDLPKYYYFHSIKMNPPIHPEMPRFNNNNNNNFHGSPQKSKFAIEINSFSLCSISQLSWSVTLPIGRPRERERERENIIEIQSHSSSA